MKVRLVGQNTDKQSTHCLTTIQLKDQQQYRTIVEE